MAWFTRALNVFRPKKRDTEIDAELAFHLAERADELAAGGLAQAAAQREARRRFGNYLQLKEETRDMDISRSIDALVSDLRHAARRLRMNPGFTIVAVLSLALGIGANSAMFQLLNAVRLRPLPVSHPEQLAVVTRLSDFFASGWSSGRNEMFTYSQLEEISRRQQAFSGLAAFGNREFNLSDGGEVRNAAGLYITPNFLNVMGVDLQMGSWQAATTDPRDCTDAGVLLNHSFWRQEFGGDPGVIGRTMTLNGKPFSIRAVAPPHFVGVEPGYRFDVAIPVCADAIFSDDGKGRLPLKWAWWLTMIGRLNPGWTVERAGTHLQEISPSVFKESLPDTYRPDAAERYLKNRLTAASANAGVSSVRTEYESSLWILLAMTGLVLLIACANLANLLLARASAREREAAVRLALGTSRARLVVQLMAESVLLAATGAILGAWLAHTLGAALVAFLGGSDRSLYVPLGLDWRVVFFTTGVATGTCLLFGLVPALRATAVTPAAVMHGGRGTSATGQRHGLRRVLVVSQVALSFVLLVGALLFGQSLRNLRATETGMMTEGVVAARLSTRTAADRRLALFADLETRVGRLPDVASSASVLFSPFGGYGWNEQVYADGGSEKVTGWLNRAGPGYFATMHTTLVAGRDFTSADRAGTPNVAIVNQLFATRVFGNADPIGRRFRMQEDAGKTDPEFTVVGIVGDTKYGGLRESPRAIAFLPVAQDVPVSDTLSLMVRARGDFGPVLKGIEREMAAVDPSLLVRFTVLDTAIADSLLRDRLIATLSSGFGVLAVVLSTLGLYGVMSYMVTRRRPEIGVRMALGARRLDILRLVLVEATGLVLVGVVIGAGSALWLSKYAETLLVGIAPRDMTSLVLAAGVLAVTAAIAAFMPARRATGVDAAIVLRGD